MKTLGLLIVLIFLVLASYVGYQYFGANQPTIPDTPNFRVSFLDVGQADAALICSEGTNWLIDAGKNEDGDDVVKTLQAMGISRLDGVVGTHPHEDHIGGLDTVINNFKIGQVFLSRASSTTRTYEDVLKALQQKYLHVSIPAAGSVFKLGQAEGTWLGPNGTSYDEINDYSLVMRLVYNNWSFLFTGDAGIIPEKEMLASGYPLQSTVLKVSHHGSNSATSAEFLNTVAPKYAVICVSKDNDYDHPHAETLIKLNSAGSEILMTDMNGDVTFTVDGIELEIKTQK